MRDEPETRARPEPVMLRMNDNPHGEHRTAHLGRDARIRGEQSPRPLRRSREGGSLWVRRACAEGTAVPSAEQRPERHREAISGQDQRQQSSPLDAADPALDGYAADRAEAGAAATFPATLHGGRHRPAGGGGRGARGSVRSSHATPFAAGVGGIWGPEVPAAGRHLGVAHLQPAPLHRLHQDPGARATHASAPGGDWGAASARPERAARLSTGGHSASGPLRRQAGSVSHQRGRHGDAVASGGVRGNHLRARSDSGAGGHAASVPVPHPGLPLRQRLGVSESESGPIAEQAAGGGVHQITRLSHDRQRSGGGQERRGGAQADRLRSDWRRARGGVSKVLHGPLQSVPELPSSVRIRHRADQCAGQTPAPVPAPRLPYTLRRAHLAGRLEEAFEGSNHRADAAEGGQANGRYRGGSTDAGGQAGPVDAVPPEPMISTMATTQPPPQRCGNAGPWKAWKTKLRFPTLSTALGNRKQRDFHIPTAPTTASSLSQQNQKTKPPARALRALAALELPSSKGGVTPQHEAWNQRFGFRLISRWNQNPVSGSFLDWKMLPFVRRVRCVRRTARKRARGRGAVNRS